MIENLIWSVDKRLTVAGRESYSVKVSRGNGLRAKVGGDKEICVTILLNILQNTGEIEAGDAELVGRWIEARLDNGTRIDSNRMYSEGLLSQRGAVYES